MTTPNIYGKNFLDFNKCRQVFGKMYGGANGKKIAIELDGNVYMLKFPPSGKGKPTQLSYTNSCISEYISCHIFNMLGVVAQDTLLGDYNGKVVCACRDFTIGSTLYDFCSLKNTVLNSDTEGAGTELSEILETIELQTYVDSDTLLRFFWDMFAVDTLIGNFDRHNGNWGFLYSESQKEFNIAPVYDCGSSLLPQADDTVMRKVLEDKNELLSRILTFPTSAIKVNGRKLNYHDYINGSPDPLCIESLARIATRYDSKGVIDLVDSMPCITQLQKEFYKTYIQSRFDILLSPFTDTTIAYDGKKYDVDTVCEYLPKSVVDKYSSRRECAEAYIKDIADLL